MRSGIAKIPNSDRLEVTLTPPVARVALPEDRPLQEVVLAIRSSGSAFDGKVWVQEDPSLTDAQLAKLSDALYAVPGVKSAGVPDPQGRRVVTLDVKKRTSWAGLVQAGRRVDVQLTTPPK